MTPQFMQHPHNPPHSYGDCLSACIASILDISIEKVSNFSNGYVNHLTDDEVWQEVLNFLYGYNLTTLIFPDSWIAAETLNHHYIKVQRTSNGTYHATVQYAGKLVHDPDPKQVTLTDSLDDCIIILVRK